MTDSGTYKIGTISRLTGITPSLLRAWERRYGFLNPERGPGGQRMYTGEDLRILGYICNRLAEGRTIGEIAALGRQHMLELDIRKKHAPQSRMRSPALDAVRQELVEAALSLNKEGITQRLEQIVATYSPDIVIEQVIEVVAKEIGNLWESGRCSVASEHLITSIFDHRIRRLIENAEVRADAPAVVAACLPGEEHKLGILILCYFLNRCGIRVLCLGSNLPLDDVRRASALSGPDGILLSVTRAKILKKHRPELLTLAAATGERTLLYLGGQAVPRADAQLENRGVRLIRATVSASDASRRIADDLRSSLHRASKRQKARPLKLGA